MKRADDCKDTTNPIEELIRLLRGLVIWRKSPTWTCGSEMFCVSSAGPARSAGSSFCVACLGLGLWVSCCGRAGKRERQQNTASSEGAACSPGWLLCPVCLGSSAQRGLQVQQANHSWEDSAVSYNLSTTKTCLQSKMFFPASSASGNWRDRNIGFICKTPKVLSSEGGQELLSPLLEGVPGLDGIGLSCAHCE